MLEKKKNGENIEIEDITVINDAYQDLGKEPEEKKEEEPKAEEKAEDKEEKPAEEKKEEAKEEATKDETPKEEPKAEEKNEEPVKIEAPVIPMPTIDKAPVDIPSAPISETPSIKFPQAPIAPAPVIETPAAPTSTPAPLGGLAGGLSFGQDLVQDQPIGMPAAPTNFNSEEEIHNFFDGLVEKANRRHDEEINGIEEARTAALGTFMEKKAIKEWRAKLMDYSAFEQPVAPAATYTQVDDPLKKIA